MTFFYDLNKRLADLAKKQDQQQIVESKKAEVVAQSPLTKALNESAIAERSTGDYSAKKARAGKDIGKPGKAFSKIAKSAGEKYGSKERGEKVAGAVLAKLRKGGHKEMEESALQAYLGDKKYGKTGMDALRKAGREHAGKEKMAKIRAKYDKMDEAEATCNECGMYESHCECPGMKEGNAFTGALAKTPKGGKFKVGDKEFTDTSSIEEADVLSQFEEEMTPKQKAFAKLAPPKDKITFADKIAGAKKEVDEMLGDVAAEAMRAALGKGKKVVADEDGIPSSTGGTIHKTPTGLRHVAGKNYGALDVSGDDEDDNTPKVKGRPKGSKRAIGAKVKGTSKLHSKPAIAEGDSSKLMDELRELRRIAQMVQTGKADFPKGFASHLESILYAVMSAMKQQSVQEKAPPGAKAERMVKHIKKGYAKDGKLTDKEKSIAYATAWKAHNKGKVEEESTEQEDEKAERAGKKVAKDIEHDEGHKAKGDNKAEKAGKKVTKDIEYDDKKDKEEKVDETTTSGSVATASSAPKSSKGMAFGKGVYESLDKQFKQALTESIQVQENLDECGMEGSEPGITIQASGEDAMKLMQLLKLAGLTGDTCPGCGHSPCDCDSEMVDENSPDWPTNTETIDADPNLRTYSSGLNGPKSTGQTTIPVIASQLRRQASMEESVKLEKTLSDLYKNYKG